MFIFFFFILGSVIGSFLNVCIYRLPQKMSLSRPRSHCPHCGRVLGPLDLVPVLSYLALRGRCRTCARPISHRYCLVELASGLSFSLIYLTEGLGPWAYLDMAFAALVITSWLTLYDQEDLDIKIKIGLLILAGLALGLGQESALASRLTAGLGGALLALAYRRAGLKPGIYLLLGLSGLYLGLNFLFILSLISLLTLLTIKAIIRVKGKLKSAVKAKEKNTKQGIHKDQDRERLNLSDKERRLKTLALGGLISSLLFLILL